MLEHIHDKLPEYYPTMHRDGYTPEQILVAVRKKMRNILDNADSIDEIIITTKEKKNWSIRIIPERKKQENQF